MTKEIKAWGGFLMPRPSAKYVGLGPLSLARLTHQYEGEDDVEFLAIQDAVTCLKPAEQEMYRLAYLEMIPRRKALGDLK